MSHIRSIGKYAFAKCDSLSDIAIGDALEEIHASSFQDSGYYVHHGKWKGGLLYLGKWVTGCKGATDEYIIKKDTIGIAADVFANEWHIKRTKNPEYDDAMIMFDTAMVCFSAPMPDLSRIPECFEEIFPAQICYEGTSEEWGKVIKLCGEKRIPASITTTDGTMETSL